MSLHVTLGVVTDDGIDLGRAITTLSAADRARAAGIGAPARLREFVLGRLLARHMLHSALGGAWTLHADPGRRPLARADDGRTHAAINLSHSRGVVACALGRAGDAPPAAANLGCDVEARRPRAAASWRRIADGSRTHPMFGATERAWLCAGADDERDDRLIALWTVKEALGKADGRGIHRGALHAREADVVALGVAIRAGTGEFTPVPVDGTWMALVARLDAHWLSVVTPVVSPSMGDARSTITLATVELATLLRGARAPG